MGGKTNSYYPVQNAQCFAQAQKEFIQLQESKLQKAAEEKKEMEEIVSELQKALTAKQGKNFSAYNLLLHPGNL